MTLLTVPRTLLARTDDDLESDCKAVIAILATKDDKLENEKRLKFTVTHRQEEKFAVVCVCCVMLCVWEEDVRVCLLFIVVGVFATYN